MTSSSQNYNEKIKVNLFYGRQQQIMLIYYYIGMMDITIIVNQFKPII